MQFEVNEQPYFLKFMPEKGGWILFKPTGLGIEAVPVVDDDEPVLFPDEFEVTSDTEVVKQ